MSHPDCIACTWSGVDEAEYAAHGCPDCNCEELEMKIEKEIITFQTEGEMKFAKSVVADLVTLRDVQHRMKIEIGLIALGVMVLNIVVVILALKVGGKI